VIAIKVHVTGGDPGLNGIIYDLEIKFGEQSPPWPSGEILGTEPPYGGTWLSQAVPGGIGVRTESTPLVTCTPITVVVGAPPGTVGGIITIHATDKDHGDIGTFGSQPQQASGQGGLQEMDAAGDCRRESQDDERL